MSMDRRNFLKTLGILSLTTVTGCVSSNYIKKALEDGLYDFDDILVDCYDDLLDGVIEFDTKIKYKHDKKTGEEKSYGLGFRKGNKLITTSHLIRKKNLRLRTPFGIAIIPTETIDRKVFFPDGEGEIIFEDVGSDIAVIEMPKEYKREFPFGNSDELKIGTYTTTVGKSLGKNVLVKSGRVVSTSGKEKLYLSDLVGKENVFLVWGINIPGDSGGAVYAFRDGNPEIVGMVDARYDGIGENHKINHILTIVKKYI